MPLFYHCGALGDFLLSLPLMKAVRSLEAGDWTVAMPDQHARLVSKLFPHVERRSPDSVEFAPMTPSLRNDGKLRELVVRYGGLCGFVERARDLESRLRSACDDQPVILAESLASAVKGGSSVDDVLSEVLVRLYPDSHAVRRLLRPGGVVPAELFCFPERDLPATAQPLEDASLRFPDAPFALLHPGAGDRRKCAPLALLEAVATKLQKVGWNLLWVRGPAEIDRGDPVPRGRLWEARDLVQLAHVLAGSQLYVGNDSGPTHLSAVLGTPTVVVFGGGEPGTWRPRGRLVAIAGGSSSYPSESRLFEVVEWIVSRSSRSAFRRCR